MFFGGSGRPDSFGGTDIYASYRADIHDDFGWQTPTNLGPNINTAAEEIASSYFDNGDAPQLYFGSTKPGGLGATDLYVSGLQADGSWGPATPVAELTSTSNENHPHIRRDGLEISFYSDRPGGSGGNDLWVATRAAVDAPWSAPVNLGPTVNSSANEVHAYLSADATTMYFGSNRPGGFGASDLYVTTREQIFPATRDECKNDGWERFGIYKNQGDCVSYVATGGENQPGSRPFWTIRECLERPASAGLSAWRKGPGRPAAADAAAFVFVTGARE